MNKITNGKKTRVLLVDDEPDIVYLVKVGLERSGLEVDVYTDPVIALQNFKRGLYQLLILDIKMPNMDGTELLSRIRKEDDKVRICFFTASGQLDSSYEKVFENSHDNFLFVPKPISILEMTKQIEQFLSR
jgi:DNA-binding response OmpR family regulator